METLNLTQEQLNQLSNAILELPTKYGLPIYNLIASFLEAQKTVKKEEISIVED